jgi:putative nucleotidyltransferase with HDIG domain
MAVPSRRQALGLLLDLRPSDWLLRHSVGVAEVAAYLALRSVARGVDLDARLVEAAALLHDLDKALPADDPRLALGHGHAGAAWLAAAGFAELGPAVAAHPVTRLGDDRHYRAWRARASFEERLVAYADKRVEQRAVSLAQRFTGWRRRYPEHVARTDVAEHRAVALEREVCALAGIAPTEVRRLRWVWRTAAAHERHP